MGCQVLRRDCRLDMPGGRTGKKHVLQGGRQFLTAAGAAAVAEAVVVAAAAACTAAFALALAAAEALAAAACAANLRRGPVRNRRRFQSLHLPCGEEVRTGHGDRERVLHPACADHVQRRHRVLRLALAAAAIGLALAAADAAACAADMR